MDKPAAFIVIGLNRDKRQIVIAGVAPSYAEGVRVGRTRKNNSELPYDCYNVFAVTKFMGEFLSAWLVHKGFSKRDAAANVRQIGRALSEEVFPMEERTDADER